MAPVYATAGEYAVWAGTSGPSHLPRLLRTASGMVAHATRAALYDTDASGKPTAGTDEAIALRDATCAQVETWVALNIDPAKGAADDGAQTVSSESKSINGANISRQYSVYASQAEARQRAVTDLCQEARLILADAGLTTAHVTTQG